MPTADWPTSGFRTRLIGGTAITLVLAETATVVLHPWGTRSGAVAGYLGIAATIIAVLTAIWTGTRFPDRRTFIISGALAAGLGLRAIGLLPFSYLPAAAPPAAPDVTFGWVLAAAYTLLFAGFFGAALGLSTRPNARRAALTALLVVSLLAVVFGFAAYGPVPSIATVLTARDGFAIVLLVGDLALLGLTAFVMLALLDAPGGALSRAWVWIFVGVILAAAGDCVMPLLEPADSALYTSLLWGVAYALIAVGASLTVDIIRWHWERGDVVNPFGMVAAEEPSEAA